jgi:hypothetical protein
MELFTTCLWVGIEREGMESPDADRFRPQRGREEGVLAPVAAGWGEVRLEETWLATAGNNCGRILLV